MLKIPEEKNVLLKSKTLHMMFFTPLYFQYTMKKKEKKRLYFAHFTSSNVSFGSSILTAVTSLDVKSNLLRYFVGSMAVSEILHKEKKFHLYRKISPFFNIF